MENLHGIIPQSHRRKIRTIQEGRKQTTTQSKPEETRCKGWGQRECPLSVALC